MYVSTYVRTWYRYVCMPVRSGLRVLASSCWPATAKPRPGLRKGRRRAGAGDAASRAHRRGPRSSCEPQPTMGLRCLRKLSQPVVCYMQYWIRIREPRPGLRDDYNTTTCFLIVRKPWSRYMFPLLDTNTSARAKQ